MTAFVPTSTNTADGTSSAPQQLTLSSDPASSPPEGAVDATSSRFHLGYRPELDGLRGIAVLLVFCYHVGRLLWPQNAGWMARGGFLGVDLFFVLSGFLITVLLLAEADRRGGRVALGSFAGRRLRRLVPVLVGLLGALLAASLAGKLYDPRLVRDSSLTVLTFTHNWAIVEGWRVGVGYLWSVAVEAQFYLLWAVVVAAAVRTRRAHGVLAVAAVVGIVAVAVWRYVQVERGENLFMLYVGTASRLDAPLVGALVGVVAAAGWLPAFRGRVAAVAGALALVLFVGAALRADFLDEPLYRGLFTVVAAGGAVCVLAAVRAGPGRLRRLLALRPLVFAGMISYSLYVWHVVIFEVVVDHTGTWRPLPRVVVGVAVALAVATLSYRFVERPFLRRRRTDQPPPKAKHRSASAPNAYIS